MAWKYSGSQSRSSSTVTLAAGECTATLNPISVFSDLALRVRLRGSPSGSGCVWVIAGPLDLLGLGQGVENLLVVPIGLVVPGGDPVEDAGAHGGARALHRLVREPTDHLRQHPTGL